MKAQKKKVHLTYEERVKIEILLEEGVSKREIARRLQRDSKSVREEIKRNSVKGIYTAVKARVKAYQRRWRARYNVFKIATDVSLRTYVDSKLKEYWSPEGISGRLKHVEKQLPYVGKDAIYAYIYSVYGRHLEEYLWWRGKRKKSHIPRTSLSNRTMIDERPKYVENRTYFGDWEGDFIVSSKQGSGALLVLVERKSRYVIIRKLFDRKVATINHVLQEIFGGGQLVADSLTLDNDISFQKHEEMSRIIGAPIYFCHPYHSWEKGTVEKINQMIRRFVPKRTDISKVCDTEIARIEKILNNRPYECLRFKTPYEVVLRSSKLKTWVESIMQREYISR